MKTTVIAASSALLSCLPVMAALPMGLKCDPGIKIVAAEIGQIGTYEVQKGMQKKKHSALVQRKTVTPVDICGFEQEVTPGRVLTVRYTGPEAQDVSVQCVDLANNNAAAKCLTKFHSTEPNESSDQVLI